jgi:homoserine kinase type II
VPFKKLARYREGVRSVYVLFHQFEFRNTKEEDIEDRAKLIGVYSNEEEAKRAIERVKGQPGFRDYPEGFVIDPYELNQDNWAEGFVTLPNVS